MLASYRAGNQRRFLLAETGKRRNRKEKILLGRELRGRRGDPACGELPEEALSLSRSAFGFGESSLTRFRGRKAEVLI